MHAFNGLLISALVVTFAASACSSQATGDKGSTSALPSATTTVRGATTQSTSISSSTAVSSSTTTNSISTTIGSGPSVTISRGQFVDKTTATCSPTTCKRVDITTNGWPRYGELQITCHASAGVTGPYIKYADKNGSFSSSTLCFYGNSVKVFVEVNGVSSNVVTPWRNW